MAAMVSPALTPEALALAVVSLQRKRANDPWDGPHGTARPHQLTPEGQWQTWLILAGRGWGKTRTGAEFIRKRVQHGAARRILIAGPTAADIRDVMIEGESGLLAVCERAGVHAVYQPSRRRVAFANGATAILVSADEPSRFRGLQSDTFWADELASWRYPESWDMLMLGHRLGNDPRGIVTTTPRPIPIIRELLADSSTTITRGSTFDNKANLADRFIEQVVKRYEGTRLGRQELYAEVLEDVEGALWHHDMIDRYRVKEAPELKRIVVAVDPATTHGEKSDETGLAVVGVDMNDEHVYLLRGMGMRVSPHEWARQAIDLYFQYEANEIVAESNQGGEMVRQTILQAVREGEHRPRIELIHASRGKQVRAEPVVSLYEQGKVHHVGTHASLEDQMCMFPVASENDDQVDAMVHGVMAVAPVRRRGFWGVL